MSPVCVYVWLHSAPLHVVEVSSSVRSTVQVSRIWLWCQTASVRKFPNQKHCGSAICRNARPMQVCMQHSVCLSVCPACFIIYTHAVWNLLYKITINKLDLTYLHCSVLWHSPLNHVPFHAGPVCRKNTMSSRFCDKLKLLGRCSLRSVQKQCCVTCGS